MAVCEYYFRRGRPLPHSLRKFYIREVHRQASKAYVSRSYPGNVTVFRAGKYAHGRGRDWQRLADSVEILEIPGADHVSIVRRPYIGVWAEALNKHLEDIGMNPGPGEK